MIPPDDLDGLQVTTRESGWGGVGSGNRKHCGLRASRPPRGA